MNIEDQRRIREWNQEALHRMRLREADQRLAERRFWTNIIVTMIAFSIAIAVACLRG